MITPKVFISYSHDTPEHKMWVMKLAQKLMDNGIEVMLDMWELGPGDDIARFMERGLMEADRILMVCTEKYVQKAEAGQGGVGYEKMIVTAGYMKQVDSKRVIPIIRQNGTDHVPAFLGTRLYMDFLPTSVLSTRLMNSHASFMGSLCIPNRNSARYQTSTLRLLLSRGRQKTQY